MSNATLAVPAHAPTLRDSSESYVGRRDLVSALLKSNKARINRVRKTTGFDLFDNEEALSTAQTALFMAPLRCGINRISEAEGLTREWWGKQRAARGLSMKNRTEDYEIIRATYPAFEEYVPSPKLKDSEVMAAATKVFHELSAGPNTDYFQYEDENKRGRTHSRWAIDNSAGLGVVDDRPDNWQRAPQGLNNWFDFTETMDPSATDRVENALIYAMLDDERNVFGPSLTRVAALAIHHYGRGGLFWLAEWLFFPGKYAELMNVIGTGWKLRDNSSEAIKRDLVRKLPHVHEAMMAILRDDPALQKMDVLMRGEITEARKTPLLVMPVDEAVSLEQQAFIFRKTEEMLDVLREAEGLTEESLEWADRNRITLLDGYLHAKNSQERLLSFTREVVQKYNKVKGRDL